MRICRRLATSKGAPPTDNINIGKYGRVAFIAECQQLPDIAEFEVFSAPEETTPDDFWLSVATIALTPTGTGSAYGRAVLIRNTTANDRMSQVYRWVQRNATSPTAPVFSDFRFLIEAQDGDCSCGG